MNFIKKWYIYQKERFPVIKFGAYIFTIVFACFCFCNYKIHGILNDSKINYFVIIPMFIVAFLQFLMVRIVDEFKDYEEDSKYRPYRPVPRGLITLKELKVLFVICVLLQVGITLYFQPFAIIYLIFVWLFFLLMTKGFFIKDFLDKHILIEAILDEFLMPILVLFLSRFIKFVNPLNSYYSYVKIKDILLLLITSYIVSCIVEIARKIRAKSGEEKGVKTYTAIYGITNATLILFIFETLLTTCEIVILGKEYILLILLVYLFIGIMNFLFIVKKTKVLSKVVELIANVYIMIVYLSFIVLI